MAAPKTTWMASVAQTGEWMETAIVPAAWTMAAMAAAAAKAGSSSRAIRRQFMPPYTSSRKSTIGRSAAAVRIWEAAAQIRPNGASSIRKTTLTMMLQAASLGSRRTEPDIESSDSLKK